MYTNYIMNFLIIEDDNFLALKIKLSFEKKFSTNNITIVSSYEWFLNELFIVRLYDVILVDINLWNNKKNWFDIIKLIRKKWINIPIIVISWSDEVDLIDYSFEIWATDYIVKPFRCEELEVRVSRWFRTYFFNLSNIKDDLINYNWLEFSLLENEFYYKWKKIILTKKNKYLLSIFLSNQEKFLSTTYLINKLWWNIELIEDKNIRVYICRLKNILKDIWIDDWINNVRWEWYIFKK